ncbi:MAG: hypothetical protein NTV86_10965 [Planctomycetota bacterium]|nr:hypothetical protein [Planctomycetota bacterium]
MKANTIMALAVAAACLTAGGCNKPPVTMPVTLIDYQRLQSENPQDYPPGNVLKLNLVRVLDTGLTEEDRLTSMEVVTYLQPRSQGDLDALATVQNEKNSPRLAAAARQYLQRVPSLPPVPDRGATGVASSALARRTDPDDPRYSSDRAGSVGSYRTGTSDTGYPAAGTGDTTARPPTVSPYDVRSQRLRELLTNGRADDLSEVIIYWGQEPAPPDERVDGGYRAAIEKITGKPWDEALLDAINQPRFTARGSAVEVLSARIAQPALVQRVAAVTTPNSEAMQVMKVFASQFGYVPGTRQELLSAVRVYRAYNGRLEQGAKLARQWRQESQGLDDAAGARGQRIYRFNIRDFHLLAGLAQDPGNSRTDRLSLVAELANSTPAGRPAPPVTGVETSTMSAAVGKMSMADLWNVWLMNGMLASPAFRADLRQVAERDLADTRAAWGGLIVYNALAKRVEVRSADAARTGAYDDVRYLPPQTVIDKTPLAMARIHGHFNRVNGAALAGPTRQEVQDAVVGNYCGLVLTRISDREFCAYYYNPGRLVLGLGTFNFND